MEQMISKYKNKYSFSQINRKLNTIQFEKDYLNISINKFILKKDKLIRNKYLSFQEKLLPYGDIEYTNQVKTENISLINEKYYWKKRELNQKIKIASEKNKIEIVNQLEKFLLILEGNHENDLKQINDKYSRLDIIPKDYQEKIKDSNKVFEEYKSKIEGLTEEKINKTKISTNRKIDKLETWVSKQKQRLDEIHNDDIESKLDNNTILRLENLCMYFGGLKAVEELSFEVKTGEIFGLIGPNGAGKTTVFNCITKFYKPTNGNTYFRNKENKVVSLNDYKVHDVIKEGIVRTFQNVELIWELSVLDNLLVAGHSLFQTNIFHHVISSRRLHQEEDVILNKARKILEDLDLIQYKDYIPVGLPYGILKRIELARTLMVDPKLIILDEPAAGLNDSETKELASLIKKIRIQYNTTIFLVEHDMGLVMDICDTVCVISFGKKLAIGKPSEIQANKLVKEAYLGGE